MDAITPGFLGPSQNVQNRMKKLRPGVKKGPATFSPRSITPHCQVLPLEFQHEFN